MQNDMQSVEQDEQVELEGPRTTEQPREYHQPPEDVNRTFERMEQLLGQIHGALDAGVREREHRELNYARLIGGVLQVIVAALVALAVLDLLLHGVVNALIVKLAFAMVLQLGALTAFVISRKD
jgi:hypothetical protein